MTEIEKSILSEGESVLRGRVFGFGKALSGDNEPKPMTWWLGGLPSKNSSFRARRGRAQDYRIRGKVGC